MYIYIYIHICFYRVSMYRICIDSIHSLSLYKVVLDIIHSLFYFSTSCDSTKIPPVFLNPLQTWCQQNSQRYGDRWQEGDVICCQVLTLGAEVGGRVVNWTPERPRSCCFWLVGFHGGQGCWENPCKQKELEKNMGEREFKSLNIINTCKVWFLSLIHYVATTQIAIILSNIFTKKSHETHDTKTSSYSPFSLRMPSGIIAFGLNRDFQVPPGASRSWWLKVSVVHVLDLSEKVMDNSNADVSLVEPPKKGELEVAWDDEMWISTWCRRQQKHVSLSHP